MPLKEFSILIKKLEQQSIVWFQASNTYVLVAHETAHIIQQLSKGLSIQTLILYSTQELGLNREEANELLTAIDQLVAHVNTPKTSISHTTEVEIPMHWYAQKHYQLGSKTIQVSYETELLEFLTHPKIAHLEVAKTNHFDHHWEVFSHQNKTILMVNGQSIGQWHPNEVHYFQGKFSMALVEQLYQKKEAEWMGVFHATAMNIGKQSILFTGDSGNGKSTLAALLLANGYTLFADDFVPVSTTPTEVYHFPAAISIKERAVPHLITMFPQLEQATSYHYTTLGKKVRYLPAPPLAKEFTPHLPCKAIVFVKYVTPSEHSFKELDKSEAFQRLIPDSWIAPEPENAQQFLNWFTQMPCYELIYSDTQLMYQTVAQLFNNDL